MNASFTIATHILAMLAWAQKEEKGPTTSDMMAGSIVTNPVVVRRVVGQLHQAGIVEGKRGAGGGIWLAIPASQLTLRQVYEAVYQEDELFSGHANGPNPKCPIGPLVASYLDTVFDRAEMALKKELEKTTLADMMQDLAALADECGSKTG